MGEVLGYVLVIALIVCGAVGLVKDGQEKGLLYVILEVAAVIVLAALGL